MKHKNRVQILVLLGIILIICFVFRRYQETLGRNDSKIELTQIEEGIQKHVGVTTEVPVNAPAARFHRHTPPSPEKHNGPQTVSALLESFGEILADPPVDEKYPQAEWLKMLLGRGIIIEDYNDYSGYMAARRMLVELEDKPELWTSDIFGLPPINDWETFKAAFIDKKIWEYGQVRSAMRADPTVTGGFFTGEDKRTFLPAKLGRIYVERQGIGAAFLGEPLDKTQQFNLLYKGITPDGYEVIYINDNGDRLSEVPFPITREEMLESLTLPPDDWMAPEDRIPPEGLEEVLREKGWTGSFYPEEEKALVEEVHTQGTQKFEEHWAENLQNEVNEDSPLTHESWDSFLESLSTEEFDELEKLLTEMRSESGLGQKEVGKQVETFLREDFSPGRFTRAIETLNRYGRRDGLRKLAEEDPEIAAYLRTLPQLKQTDSQNQEKPTQ